VSGARGSDPTCVPLLLEVSVPVEMSARLDLMLRGAIRQARVQYGDQNDGAALARVLEMFHEAARREQRTR
jgi:hypothetical protein